MSRILTVTFTIALLLMNHRASLGADEKLSKPNIVIMLVDDMGIMDTSVPFLTDDAGQPKRYPLNDYYRTPNMERLAALGIRFNNFYSMSVCSPTRIALMTGQNAARHRTTNWINPDLDNTGPNGPPDWNWRGLKKGDLTLARLMQANGYRTIHVGKGHFGPRAFEGSDPTNLGFDINVGGASIGAPASYYGQQNYGNVGGKVAKESKSAVPSLKKYHGTETFLTDALTTEANAHVADAVQAKKPFFLYFPQYAVHAPHNSDPRFAKNYVNSGKPDQAQAFATLIEGMDKSLGDMLDNLDRLGVAENTLVIFLGDNGSDAPLGHQHEVACAAPLRGKKGSHYEGGVRVPFIAAWAKPNSENAWQKRLPIQAGAIQKQQAAVYDLFPTVMTLTDQSVPNAHVIDGGRLDKLLSGQSDSSREEKFLMHYPHAPHRTDYFTTFRNGDWKVIYHYFPSDVSENSHYQLFNLAKDPFEQINVATSEPAELKRLMQGLIEGLEKQNAVYPINKDSGMPIKPLLPSQLAQQHVGPPLAEHAATNRAFQGIPSLAIASGGRLWANWYAGVTPGEDQNNYVVLTTSGDQGATWKEVLVIDPDAAGPIRSFDPELWISPDYRLFVFWAQMDKSQPDSKLGVWSMDTSQPDAEQPQWTRPRRIANGVMMCKPMTLSTGEWMLPISKWREHDQSAQMIVSNDQARTWSLRGACNVPKADRQYDEHMFVERRDGSFWLLARTKYGIGESSSVDRGKSWPDLKPSSIQHTASRFFIRRLESGNLLLIKHGPIEEQTSRSHLTAYRSTDDGKTWSGGLMLDERKGVSYPDGQQTADGTIRIIYDYNRTSNRNILMATFREEDVSAGKIVNPSSQLKQLISVASGGKEKKPITPKK